MNEKGKQQRLIRAVYIASLQFYRGTYGVDSKKNLSGEMKERCISNRLSGVTIIHLERPHTVY